VKTVIVGCGRVGSVLADAFDRAGHQVVVLDTKTSAFDRLPGAFKGAAVRGDGTDEDTLRRAGAADADVFMAMTEGDNRNVMAAQLATEALGAREVIAKINDPLRASAYAELGIATLCRTNLMATAVSDFLRAGLTFGPGLTAATGQHPGGEHHGVDDGGGPLDAASGIAAAAASAAEGAGSAVRTILNAVPGVTVDSDDDARAGQSSTRAESSSNPSTATPSAPVSSREA
jgi:trk system potassium uptake protein TrkA